MEDSCHKALEGGITKNQPYGQYNNKPSEGSVSPQNRERPQASCEDASSKTVEFLRARLLAERAASKAAKECAEQNAKRLMELERVLELEMEQRMKAESTMQDVMSKLRITCRSSASDHVESDRNGVEKQRIIEETEGLGDVCSSNSTCIATMEEEEIIKVDSNNSKPQEDGYLSANSVRCEYLEQTKGDSRDLTSENEKTKSFDRNPGFIEDQLSNQTDIKDNCLASSSPSLQDQAEHSPSTDPVISLSKDDQDDNDKGFRSPPAPESFTKRNVDTNSRAKLDEEKINELFHQMGNEVAPLAGEDQKEFLRWKLHELVDQIVCLSQKEVHKHDSSTVPIYDHSSKASSTGDSSEKIMINVGTVEISNLQPEIPYEGLNMVDSLKADKSFQTSSYFRHQNETTAPCCKWHDECGQGLHCYSLRDSTCTCQCLDFFDTFLHEKEEVQRHKFLEHKIPIKYRRTQASGMQTSLENRKSDELFDLQRRIMPQVHCDDCCHEFHLKMRSFNDRITTHCRLYHNNDKTICFRRNCNHYQAAGSMEVGKPLMFSGSDVCMTRHHDLKSSHGTSHHVKRNCLTSGFYQSMDILPHGIELSAQEYCCTYLPMQLTNNCDEIITCNKNAGHTKLPFKYKISRGTPLVDMKVPRLTRDKLGRALIALRHAKEQMESSIITKQNSSRYIDLSSLKGNVTYK